MIEYNESSIKTLEPMEHIRKHVGMYLGSKDKAGLLQCVKECISNSIDEFLNGSGSLVQIVLLPNNGIRIEDDGRGIPHGKHKSGCSNLQACVGIINTGGKFDNAGQSGYNSTGGQHGVGVKAVNAISKKFIAKTRREGLEEIVEFKQGKFVSHKENKISKNITGTCIEFYPDETVMEEPKFDIKTIKEMIQEFSFLCKGLCFKVVDEKNNVEEFYSERGLADYMDYLNGKNEFITKPIYFNIAEGKFQLEVAIGYNKTFSSIAKIYTNNIPQIKGTHLTGFKTAWTSNLNALAREYKLLKDKDENLSGSDYEEGMLLVLNFKMIDPVFKGQNKEELSSSEGRTYAQKLTTQALAELASTHKEDFKIIIEKALTARKAREAAKKAREQARGVAPKKEKGLKAKMVLSDKYTGCKNKNPESRHLLLVEGQSAAGSVIEARNVETDAIYQLRGKVLSVLKCDQTKMLANQELSDIIKVIGAGYGDTFDLSKSQFSKVVITSDADSDGAAIELLLITFFYTYMRPLVEAGMLYRAVTPLYIVEDKEGKHYFYTEQEFKNYKAGVGQGRKYSVSHVKGLGEISATQLKEICFDIQRYKRITVSDAKATQQLLEVLEGSAVEPRKRFIYDNANRLGFNFI